METASKTSSFNRRTPFTKTTRRAWGFMSPEFLSETASNDSGFQGKLLAIFPEPPEKA